MKMGAKPNYETKDGKTAAIEAVRMRQRGGLLALYTHGATTEVRCHLAHLYGSYNTEDSVD